MSSVQERLFRGYRELASLPRADGRSLGDLALLALWSYVVITSDGKMIPSDLAEALGPPPEELTQSRRTVVVTARSYLAPLLDALGERYVEVLQWSPSLL